MKRVAVLLITGCAVIAVAVTELFVRHARRVESPIATAREHGDSMIVAADGASTWSYHVCPDPRCVALFLARTRPEVALTAKVFQYTPASPRKQSALIVVYREQK